MARATMQVAADDIAKVVRQAMIGRLRRRGADVRGAWYSVMRILFAMEKQLFEAEGKTNEHPHWPDLSERPLQKLEGLSYKEWKELYFPGKPLLVLSGRLKRQLTGLSGTHYREWLPTRLTFGSNVPADEGGDLGGLHATGLRELDRFMPPRPPIRVTEKDIDDIADELVDYVLAIGKYTLSSRYTTMRAGE